MTNVMKAGYIAAIMIGVGIFNSCTDSFVSNEPGIPPAENRYFFVPKETAYGTYLAGRVAHIRQDFNTAADYYVKSVKLGADKPEIISQVYLLLASEGRIGEAAQYAEKALENGDKNNFIRFILMTNNFRHNRYEEAGKNLNSIKDKVYKESILPLFEAWVLAGQGDKKRALAALNVLKKDKSLHSLYYMHSGMVNDFFGDSKAAQKSFDTVINNENLELSFRSLQIISNFYVRNGQKEKAAELVKKYYDKNPQAKMLAELYHDVLNPVPENFPKIIDSAQKGEAEALFNIGTIFRGYQSEISQIFNALALYLNPAHDVARVSMADLLESGRRYNEAIFQYEKISRSSPIYFMAQLKIANDYMIQRQNQAALEKLNALLKEYPDEYQVLFNLGEINRILDQQPAAIRYYRQALEVIPETEKNDWTVYYALGMAYERNDEWKKAENTLQKALKISNRHPFILNYLGYTWLKHNQNPNEALFMIFEAYRENPEDGYIMDSLGWALYRMGKYEDAIKVLERAAEYLPANAIVCDHLGDAYWVAGRKAEARYQWQHALTLKEDSEELDKDLIRKKIASGAKPPATLNFNEALLVERLKSLNLRDQLD